MKMFNIFITNIYFFKLSFVHLSYTNGFCSISK